MKYIIIIIQHIAHPIYYNIYFFLIIIFFFIAINLLQQKLSLL